MSKALEIAKAHFARQEVRSFPVPEWDIEIYAAPMTLGDQDAMFKIQKKHGEGSFFLFAAVVVRRALDKDGKRLFDDGEEADLMNGTEGAVLKRIATQMMATSGVEEIKNS